MSFFSFQFLIFISISFVIYHAIPAKFRHLWLLLCSYVFYAMFDWKYLAVLILVTLVSYYCAKLVGTGRKKTGLLIGIISIILILFIFRFPDFWASGVSVLFGGKDSQLFRAENIIAPVGLSFYTLEAIGYIADAYRNDGSTIVHPDIFQYALFLSFFPKIMSGPVERSSSLLRQIINTPGFSFELAKCGLFKIFGGYYIKLLIADRIADVIVPIYDSYLDYPGATLFAASVLYSIQLYADFKGYCLIANGIGNLFGFELIQNFKQPYLSQGIGEFWSRWHISLSGWLRDYVYIPLGGNRKGTIRQWINLLITFVVSGFWHGRGHNFLFWGLLHGFYQVMANIRKRYFPGSDKKALRVISIFISFILVDLAWIFFTLPSVMHSVRIIKRIFLEFNISQAISQPYFLYTYGTVAAVLLCINVLLFFGTDILHEKGITVREYLNGSRRPVRWMAYLVMSAVFIISLLRYYGAETSSFIYALF